MKKLLLVEDDPSLGESLSERLSQEFEVLWTNTFAKAKEAIAKTLDLDLVILDVGLPDGNGFDLAKLIQEGRDTPIIFLTAQADAESRLRGYELGAHEYIPKPFHLKELLLRVHHVLRNHPSISSFDTGANKIHFLELQIERKSGERISLSATEMKVLELLIKKSPQVLHRDDIMNTVWGIDRDLSHRTIDNMILKLRTSLAEDGQKIKTVRGIGYQWLKGDL